MSQGCAYSFNDLFKAVFNRDMTPEEKADLYAQTQEARNAIVKGWAGQSRWRVEDRIGSDGIIYTAFWPES